MPVRLPLSLSSYEWMETLSASPLCVLHPAQVFIQPGPKGFNPLFWKLLFTCQVVPASQCREQQFCFPKLASFQPPPPKCNYNLGKLYLISWMELSLESSDTVYLSSLSSLFIFYFHNLCSHFPFSIIISDTTGLA